MVCASPAPHPRWHKIFLGMLPAITTHAKIAFRHLNPEAKAEAVQEVVCNALQAFVRLVQLKKTDIAYPTALAKYGVRQVKDHRKVGGHLNVRDVLSPYCQSKKGVVVERLDHRDEEDKQAWAEAIVEDRTAGPAEIARVRIDMHDWLASLKRRDRRVAEFLAKGETTKAAAAKFKVSEGRVSQLRRELAESWRRFVGDDPGPAMANAV